MQNSGSNGSSTAWARVLSGIWTVLAIVLGLTIQPAEAVPSAYVANVLFGTVSVIRAATQKMVATVAAGTGPFWTGIIPLSKTRP
ncbi:MAG: hypothetical protein ACREDV_13650 [Methylocella sp.]